MAKHEDEDVELAETMWSFQEDLPEVWTCFMCETSEHVSVRLVRDLTQQYRTQFKELLEEGDQAVKTVDELLGGLYWEPADLDEEEFSQVLVGVCRDHLKTCLTN